MTHGRDVAAWASSASIAEMFDLGASAAAHG